MVWPDFSYLYVLLMIITMTFLLTSVSLQIRDGAEQYDHTRQINYTDYRSPLLASRVLHLLSLAPETMCLALKQETEAATIRKESQEAEVGLLASRMVGGGVDEAEAG